MHPDYGIYLSKKQANNAINHHFYDIPCDHFIRVDSKSITTMVNMPIGNQVYAASFDLYIENVQNHL